MRARLLTPAALSLLLLLAGCGSEAGPTGPGATETPDTAGPQVPVAATQWLRSVAAPLERTDPAGGFDDLEPLRAAIGDARIVALGEGTHGTREFFRMKDRILRFLVTEMGFDAFAIEATWPEANRLDAYVRTGEGDPEVLLSGLYFWTWNTESVLEMIEWMRAHDEAGGDVGFYGFDMQYPGMALANVVRFVEAVDPEALPAFGEDLECMGRYANDPRGRFETPYAQAGTDDRAACPAGLARARERLLEREAEYVAASSRAEFDRAVRSVRVAMQYEAVQSGEMSRDAAMAENAEWLLDQLGPDAKIVLWAHNFHVSTVDESMGGDLRARFGDDMFVLGFAFGGGRFTAVRMEGSRFVGLAEMTLSDPLADSYEEYFRSAELPLFHLDLRDHDAADPASGWLAGPRRFRFIGCCFDPGRPISFTYRAQLPREFDALIYVERTTATRVLPFRFPGVF